MKKLIAVFSVLLVASFLFANSYRVYVGNECLQYPLGCEYYCYGGETFIQNQNVTAGIQFSSKEKLGGFSFDYGVRLATKLPENMYIDIPQYPLGEPYNFVFYPEKYACINTGISCELAFFDLVGLYLGFGVEVRYGTGFQPVTNSQAGLFQQDFYFDLGLEILSFGSNSIVMGCKANVVNYMKMGIGGEDPLVAFGEDTGSITPYVGAGFNYNKRK